MTSPIQIKKDIFGRYSIGYECSNCAERLKSPIEDAGKPDSCPNCRDIFIVPGEAERSQLREQELLVKRQREEAESLKREEKLQRKRYREAAAAEARLENAKRRVIEQRESALVEQQRREREELERQQREQESRFQSCAQCGAQVQSGANQCEHCGRITRKIRFGNPFGRKFTVLATFCALFVAYGWAQNSGLREKLKACDSYNVVNARVSYKSYFSTDTVVFDLRDGGSGEARRIDPVHLLMQFSGKLDLYSIRSVILARNGRHVFYIDSSDLRPLADSYADGGRIWAFNNLPPKVHTMSGTHPYSEWTGGWLGVMKQQTEDLNDFIETWTGY